MELLDTIKGKTLEKVLYHEWTSDECSFLDWIQLIFSDKNDISLSLGSIEETLEILEGFDTKKEQMCLNEIFGVGKVLIRSSDCSGSRKWKNFTGEKITDYRTENTAEGMLKSVTIFSGAKAIHISAGQDNLEVKIPTK